MALFGHVKCVYVAGGLTRALARESRFLSLLCLVQSRVFSPRLNQAE